MSVALRTITRLQDADDINVSLGVGVDEYALCWDNDTSRFVLRAMSAGVTDHGALTGLADDDHTQYLLATGTRAGASSQAQTFTSGIVGPTWRPAADSTTALQLQNAAGTAILTVDTTNSRIGIGTTAPSGALQINVAGENPKMRITNKSVLFSRDFADASPTFGVGIEGTSTLNGGLRLSSLYGVYAYQDATMLFSATTSEIAFFSDGSGVKMIGAVVRGADHLGLQTADNRFTVTIKQNSNASGTANVLNVQTQSGGAALSVDHLGKTGIGTAVPGTLIHGLLSSAATNAVTNVLTIGHNSTGTAANGFGAGQAFTLATSTTGDQSAARIQVLWSDATHATRKADLVLTAYDSGGEREGLRIRGAGSAPAIGFLGAAPVTRIAHVADPAGGATVDAEARSAINSILTTLESFGFHATS